MKIVVFHLPYPMGNYKLNEYLADTLQSAGHDVYLLQQLNGHPYNEDYYQQIKEIEPDVLYYEMLDKGTFEVVEKFNCKKILNIMGTGILKENFVSEIKNYKDKWYTHIITNSQQVYDLLKDDVAGIEHFKYYFCAIKDSELVKNPSYAHDCVFLGQGHHRLSMPEFVKELDVYFKPNHDFDFKVYGSGWPSIPWYRGLLPPNDIGSLYSSVKSAVSVIEPEQYRNGMINNRYVELGFCKTPIITFQYDNIDWYGAEPFLNIIDSYSEFNAVVTKAKHMDDNILKKAEGMKMFIDNQHEIFFEKLKRLLGK
jgi:hypothetical protein